MAQTVTIASRHPHPPQLAAHIIIRRYLVRTPERHGDLSIVALRVRLALRLTAATSAFG